MFKKWKSHKTSNSAPTVLAATTASPIVFISIDWNFLHAFPENCSEVILTKQHFPSPPSEQSFADSGFWEFPHSDLNSFFELQSTLNFVAISLNSSISSILFSDVSSITTQEVLLNKSFSPSTKE